MYIFIYKCKHTENLVYMQVYRYMQKFYSTWCRYMEFYIIYIYRNFYI